MSERRHIEPVEDFTSAFLVSFGVVIFMALFAVHALLGILAAVASGWLINKTIALAGAVSARRRYERGPKRW